MDILVGEVEPMSRTPRPPRWEGEDKAGDLGKDPELQAEVYEEQASRQPQLIPFLFAWTQPDEIRDRSDYLTRMVRRRVPGGQAGIPAEGENPR
ncbi:MAG: hypothetical protein QME93_08785 [Bacillota bacterium]|nr:hypothetical protein [Bacillota bacterium]